MAKRIAVSALSVMLAAASAAQEVAPPGPQPTPVRRMRMMSAPPPAFQGDEASAPFTFSRAAPVVEVTIGGKGPYKFLIDTGTGGHGRISAALAQQLGLAVAGEAVATDGSGRTQRRSTYNVGDLELGGVKFSGVRMGELPLLPGRERELDGILGIDLFASHLLTLDYGTGRMTLSRGQLPASALSYPAGPGPIALPVTIGEVEIVAHLDTGNSVAPLIVPKEVADRLRRAGEPRSTGQARTAISTIDMWEADLAAPVRVGGQTLPIRTIAYPSLGANGNLGSKALAGAVLQVDQRNRRVRIETSAAPAASPAR